MQNFSGKWENIHICRNCDARKKIVKVPSMKAKTCLFPDFSLRLYSYSHPLLVYEGKTDNVSSTQIAYVRQTTRLIIPLPLVYSNLVIWVFREHFSHPITKFSTTPHLLSANTAPIVGTPSPDSNAYLTELSTVSVRRSIGEPRPLQSTDEEAREHERVEIREGQAHESGEAVPLQQVPARFHSEE